MHFPESASLVLLTCPHEQPMPVTACVLQSLATTPIIVGPVFLLKPVTFILTDPTLQDMVPVPSRSPGRRLQPVTV